MAYGRNELSEEDVDYTGLRLGRQSDVPEGFRMAFWGGLVSLKNAIRKFERIRVALGHQITLSPEEVDDLPGEHQALVDAYASDLMSNRSEAIREGRTGPQDPTLPEFRGPAGTGLTHETCSGRTRVVVSGATRGSYRVMVFRRVTAEPLGAHGREDLCCAIGIPAGEPGSKECRAADAIGAALAALGRQTEDGPIIQKVERPE